MENKHKKQGILYIGIAIIAALLLAGTFFLVNGQSLFTRVNNGQGIQKANTYGEGRLGGKTKTPGYGVDVEVQYGPVQ